MPSFQHGLWIEMPHSQPVCPSVTHFSVLVSPQQIFGSILSLSIKLALDIHGLQKTNPNIFGNSWPFCYTIDHQATIRRLIKIKIDTWNHFFLCMHNFSISVRIRPCSSAPTRFTESCSIPDQHVTTSPVCNTLVLFWCRTLKCLLVSSGSSKNPHEPRFIRVHSSKHHITSYHHEC